LKGSRPTLERQSLPGARIRCAGTLESGESDPERRKTAYDRSVTRPNRTQSPTACGCWSRASCGRRDAAPRAAGRAISCAVPPAGRQN